METSPHDEVLEKLEVLGRAVVLVRHIHRTTLDAYATERTAREKLFHQLAATISCVLPAIAEITREHDDGLVTRYLRVDERKGRTWFLGHRDGRPSFLASASPRGEPEPVPLHDGLRVIRFDELARRTATRLLGVLNGLEGRAESARHVAERLEAVAVLLRP